MLPHELDLSYNPFDEDNDEQTPQNRPYFGAAFLPNVQTPRTRRRSSFGSPDSATIRRRHTRSRTEVNIEIPDAEISGHPLKSAALRSAAFQDFEITRPHLSRILQTSGTITRSLSDGSGPSGSRSPSVEEEEMEVIVHEVCFC
jgi:hypothetical protein